MPISEKIMTQVNISDADQDEKELMLKILHIEDRGSFRYQSEYESLIKKYIDKHKEAKE
mgnify:FL=1